MGIFSFFLIAGCCLYTGCIVILMIGLHNIRPGFSSRKPFVSVIIAARNERAQIGACLASLMNQSYSDDSYEVIVADDRSADTTAEVLHRFMEVWSQLRVIKIRELVKHTSPKKHALSEAMRMAHGEIILQTDADCIVPREWISGMVRGFGEGIGMVTGIAPYHVEPGTLNSFVRHEYLWNAALSASSIALGYGTHASSRNIAFRKDAFDRIGGYGFHKNVLSGDDTLLLHRMQKLKDSRVVTVTDSSTHVHTHAPQDFMSFVHQRIRHMSTGKYFNPFLIAVGGFVYGFHLLMLFSIPLSLCSIQILKLFAGIVLWKLFLDGLMAWRTTIVLGLNVQWKRFVINDVFLMLYMATMPFLGLVVPIQWKEK